MLAYRAQDRIKGVLHNHRRNPRNCKLVESSQCQMVAMESTGSYLKPLYNIFEQENVPAMVVNAYYIKNVPGRKTDWNDAFWIAKCMAQGLLKPSFVPNREQRELRDMTRFRKSQIEERSRNINRLQKFLEGANVKLGSWLAAGCQTSKEKALRSFWN